MNALPIVHVTLYKHGVGYYRRRGAVKGESVELTFRREEMDDLLKSLTVIDYGTGGVRGVDYDTPQSREEKLAGNSIVLADARSVRDLLRSLRGRSVQLALKEGRTATGTLVGLDEDDARPLEVSVVSLLAEETETVLVYPLDQLLGVTLRDGRAAADLRFFLKSAQGEESHRSITVRLTPGKHDLEVGYIAPAPTWRVSYRLVTETTEAAAGQAKALLQGWGIFDNRLEEDLVGVELTLTAGMPISFIYDLYTPHTPRRPRAKDEERTAAAPVMLKSAIAEDLEEEVSEGAIAPSRAVHALMAPSLEDAAESVESAAEGEALGELFQYRVKEPVTVARGQSAMVPIVTAGLEARRELVYNREKMPVHPVAVLRFENASGLTLERGPVTVLENGEYVGEGVLPFAVAGEEAVIAYAVELSVRVKEKVEWEEHFHTLDIKKSYLLEQYYRVRKTTYEVDNHGEKSRKVLLEHPPAPGYEVFDTPDPAEKTADTLRYAVEAAPGKVTSLTVRERMLRARKEEIRSLSHKKLKKYLKNRFLDAETFRQLEALLGIWDEIDRLEEEIEEEKEARKELWSDQKRIQKTMNALSEKGEEGRLRSQYVEKLKRSEEDLARIERRIREIKGAIEGKKTELEKRMEALEK